MSGITIKQIIFMTLMLLCTLLVLGVHFFSEPSEVIYKESILHKLPLYGTAVIPTTVSDNGGADGGFTRCRIPSGRVTGACDGVEGTLKIEIMLMLIAIGLFIKPEIFRREFMFDSDGMK